MLSERYFKEHFSSHLPAGSFTSNLITFAILKHQLISEVIFEQCLSCIRMASIPQGAFAAQQVRQSLSKVTDNGGTYTKTKDEKSGKMRFLPPIAEQSPLKYNSKLMNSIWGQYNRYSVHNLKKNTDAKQVLLWAEQRLATATPPAFYMSGFNPANVFNWNE